MAVDTPVSHSSEMNKLIKLIQACSKELRKAIEALKITNTETTKLLDAMNSMSPLYNQLLNMSDSGIVDKEGDAWFCKALQTTLDMLNASRDSVYRFLLMNQDDLDAKLSDFKFVLDNTVQFMDRLKLRINFHVTSAGMELAVEEAPKPAEPVNHQELLRQQLRHFGEKSVLLGDPMRAIAALCVGNDVAQKRTVPKLTQMAQGGHVPELVESGAIPAVCRFIQAGGEPPMELVALLAGDSSDSIDEFRLFGGEEAVTLVHKALGQSPAGHKATEQPPAVHKSLEQPPAVHKALEQSTAVPVQS